MKDLIIGILCESTIVGRIDPGIRVNQQVQLFILFTIYVSFESFGKFFTGILRINMFDFQIYHHATSVGIKAEFLAQYGL